MEKTSVFKTAFAKKTTAKPVTIPRPEYPRPQFVRPDWLNLNGKWEFEFDFGLSGLDRGLQNARKLTGRITVPFCPESKLSGVEHTDFIPAMFYRRELAVPAKWQGRRILLHFGGVDTECELFIDGNSAGHHYGGMVSFTFDITNFVTPGQKHNLVLFVRDDLRSGRYGVGKQCAVYHSEGCDYTRTTGIWQTVWLESAPMNGLASVKSASDITNGIFIFVPRFFRTAAGQTWEARVKSGGKIVGSATGPAADGVPIPVKLSEKKLWEPGNPFLYDVEYIVRDADGKEIDFVSSYAGLREVRIDGSDFLINGKKVFQRLVLDQGFYPDGIWTAPSDAALKNDIELSLGAGFNGARLHQKVFEERFHYWADKLGYLTWAESASWGLDYNQPEAKMNFMAEWIEAVDRDVNHPSIIAWSPLNESNNLTPNRVYARFPNPSKLEIYRRWVREIYEITKKIDPTRPINDASGFIHAKTDLWTVHQYHGSVENLQKSIFAPDGSIIRNAPDYEVEYSGQPFIVAEFGGSLYIAPEQRKSYSEAWGYSDSKTVKEWLKQIKAQVDFLLADSRVAGFCYTQLTDVEQEQNGVYYYNRKAKTDPAKLASIFGATPKKAKSKQ